MYAQRARSLRWAVLGCALSAVAVTTGLTAGEARAAVPWQACERVGDAETLIVTGRSQRAAYTVGSTAKIHVAVTRGSEGYSGLPAAGVNVAAGVTIRDAYLHASAVTNEAGQATLRIRLRRFAGPGVAEVKIEAWQNRVDGPCVDVTEFGRLFVPRMFAVRR